MPGADITWPAYIKYAGENELMFIPGEAEWKTDANLSAFAYEVGDFLVDSNGNVFNLHEAGATDIREFEL